MAGEEDRTRLIGQIASLLRDTSVPAEAREAGLTLIGWLARRMPGEPVSIVGVEEMCRRCTEHRYDSYDGTNGAHVSRVSHVSHVSHVTEHEPASSASSASDGKRRRAR
jgi:hypothetical protein